MCYTAEDLYCQDFIAKISHFLALIHPLIIYPQMVELTPGSQVYIFQNLVQHAVAKSSFKSAASFLLNCFYSNDELLGMNLTGANGKPHPDKDIIESIIGV